MSDRRPGPLASATDRIRSDRRAVSVALTQVLTLAITTVLISGLLMAGGGALENQETRVVDNGLGVVGERLASEVVEAERLAERGADSRVELATRHPSRVAGRPYTVELTDGDGCAGDACLVLTSSAPRVTVTVSLATDASVTESTVPGGAVRVVADGRGVGTTIRLEGPA